MNRRLRSLSLFDLDDVPPVRVVVTGGATNIGRAISEAFLIRGARVVVGQPDPAVAELLVTQYGPRFTVLPVDVGVPEQCRQFIDAAARALGGIDVLVNNAAITGPGAARALKSIDPAHVQALLAVNLGGPIFCSQAAVPHLRKAGGGVIVHVSSVNAYRPQRGAMVYAATKAALSSLTRSMARELAPRIRVVAVAPGDIAPARPPGRRARPRKKNGDFTDDVPLGTGDIFDVAETVYFLCTERAKYVTGSTWLVDGGMLA